MSGTAPPTSGSAAATEVATNSSTTSSSTTRCWPPPATRRSAPTGPAPPPPPSTTSHEPTPSDQTIDPWSPTSTSDLSQGPQATPEPHFGAPHPGEMRVRPSGRFGLYRRNSRGAFEQSLADEQLRNLEPEGTACPPVSSPTTRAAHTMKLPLKRNLHPRRPSRQRRQIKTASRKRCKLRGPSGVGNDLGGGSCKRTSRRRSTSRPYSPAWRTSPPANSNAARPSTRHRAQSTRPARANAQSAYPLTNRQACSNFTNRQEVGRSKIADYGESTGHSTFSAVEACTRPSDPQYGQRDELTRENGESAAWRGAVRRSSASLRLARRNAVLDIFSTNAGQ